MTEPTAQARIEASCPHCGHDWARHTRTVHTPERCDCGCMWQPPKPPEPPPTPADLLNERIQAAIFDELDKQHEADEIDGAGYWDREWDRVDGEPNWTRIAAAIIKALGLTEEVSIRVGGLTGCVMSRAQAEENPDLHIVATRWLTPWARTEPSE